LQSVLDTGAVYEVQLSDPIHHVHSVSLLSFTLPNELYNVDKFNDRVTMILWSSTYDVKVWSNTIQLTHGIYTLDNMVTALNEFVSNVINSTASEFGLPSGDYTKPLFGFTPSEFMTDAEVAEITVATGTDGLLSYVGNNVDRVAFVMSSDTDQHSFKHSIWHRLGFVELQVPRVSADVTPSTLNTLYLNSAVRGTIVNLDYTATSIKAMHLGTESFDNLFVACDVVSGQTYRTLHNANSNFGGNAVANTTRSDLIGIIPVSAPLGGLLTWTRPTDNYMRIGLSGRKPVDNLRISITSDRGTPFARANFPGFSAVIEFTVIEHVDKINAQVHQANQRAAFLSRHMPMQLE